MDARTKVEEVTEEATGLKYRVTTIVAQGKASIAIQLVSHTLAIREGCVEYYPIPNDGTQPFP